LPTLRQPSGFIGPETVTAKTDGHGINWKPWERDYREKLGVELTEADKLEIRANVSAFFGLLREIEAESKCDE
jgi:hypothetical protein